MNNLVSEVLERIDARELVGSYLSLQKSGKSFKAICPFHAEKTPSFHLDPIKKLWYCFGCNEGGSLIDFYMKMEKLSFKEAIAALAERAGLELQWQTPRGSKRKELLLLMTKAVIFFKEQRRDPHFAAFVQERKLSQTTIDLFQLGFSSPQHSLFRALRKDGFSKDLIFFSGLVLGSGNQIKERFQNRIIIPICSPSNQVVGFSGRAIGKAMPKYINSPDSPIFKKRELLYGFHQAKSDIKKTKCVLLVEGYADVWQCFENGFCQALASMGTALTQDQISLITRFSENVTLCFDGDIAGLKAMARTLNSFFKHRVALRIISMPSDTDPDEFLRTHKKEVFQQLLSEAKPFYAFYLDYLVRCNPSNQIEKRAKLRDETKAFLHSLTDPLLQNEALSYALKQTNFTRADLTLRRVQRKERSATPYLQGHEKVEIEALSALLTDHYQLVRERLIIEDFSLPSFREIARLAFELIDEEGCVSLSQLQASLSDEGRTMLAKIMVQSDRLVHINKNETLACIERIEQWRQKRKINELKQVLSAKLKDNDLDTAAQLFEQYKKLKKATFA